MSITTVPLSICLLVSGALTMLLYAWKPEVCFWLTTLFIRSNTKGLFLVEVHKTWYFGSGKTLYRNCFSTEKAALKVAKAAALYYDRVLPKSYMAQMRTAEGLAWYRESHEFGISWSVITLQDHYNFEDQELTVVKIGSVKS